MVKSCKVLSWSIFSMGAALFMISHWNYHSMGMGVMPNRNTSPQQPFSVPSARIDAGRRTTTAARSKCIEQVQSSCANEILNSTNGDDGEDFMRGVLTTCKVKYGPQFHIERGISLAVASLTILNALVVEEKVCWTEEGGADVFWKTSVGWLRIATGGSSSYTLSENETKIELIVTPVILVNYYIHLGNGVFVEERHRGNTVLTTLGVPADVEDVPDCIYEVDDDGVSIWEDTLSLTPQMESDLGYRIRSILNGFISFAKKIAELSKLFNILFTIVFYTKDPSCS